MKMIIHISEHDQKKNINDNIYSRRKLEISYKKVNLIQ